MVQPKKSALYMVMEYIKGQTVFEKMRSQEKQGNSPLFSENDALFYIRQVALALIFAHDRHPPILHRDLKPQNIMLREDRPEAVLIDFGLARNVAANPVNTAMPPAYTSGFAPIEQYSNKPIRLPATDVYGLAATLYYMLTAKVPTDANDRAQGEQLVDPKQYNPDISEQTCQAIMQGLAFKLEDRPQTMQKWLDLLDEANRKNINRKNANIYFEQALEKQYKGDSQGALNDYNRVISINPELVEAYYYRAIVRTTLEDKKGAISDYNHIKKIASNSISEFEDRNISIVKNCLMSQYDESYEKLEYFLQHERWLEANSQTIGLLLLMEDNTEDEDGYRFAGKGWLSDLDVRDMDIQKFLEIDKLWVKYSQSTLGFSIQYKMYAESENSYNPTKLGRDFGWYFGVEQEFMEVFDWRYCVNYKTINWVNPTKILGHLPYLGHTWLIVGSPRWTSYYDFIAAREYSYSSYNQENIDEEQENYYMFNYGLCDVLQLFSRNFER
jgi:serine/threonine protein kinase